MMPPDWRSTRRVSELRTEPLWGLQCDRSESQAAFFYFLRHKIERVTHCANHSMQVD